MQDQEYTGKVSAAAPVASSSFAREERHESIPRISYSITEAMSAANPFDPVNRHQEATPQSSLHYYAEEPISPTSPSFARRSASQSSDRHPPPALSPCGSSSEASTALSSPDETAPSLAHAQYRHASGSSSSSVFSAVDPRRSSIDVEKGRLIAEHQEDSPLWTSSYMLQSTMAAMHADARKDSAGSILAASRAALAARTTSIDVNMGHEGGSSRNALDKLSRRKSVAVQRAKERSSISSKAAQPEWRERKPEAQSIFKIAQKK